MRTISIINKDNKQTIHIPKDMEFSGVDEVEIMRKGNTLILRPVRPVRPVRPDWLSFAKVEKADNDFSIERPPIIAPLD